jgi:hypothetical protein
MASGEMIPAKFLVRWGKEGEGKFLRVILYAPLQGDLAPKQEGLVPTQERGYENLSSLVKLKFECHSDERSEEESLMPIL